MSIDSGAPAADAAPATGELTLHEAGLLLDAGYEQNPDLHDTERGAPEATAPKLEGDDPDNSAPETDPAEKPEGNDPEENLPPIERPRSWSKDADDDWNAIPRARQEKIAANEQARESDIRQRINEAAEKSKAAEAKLSEVEKVRQQYESKLTSTVKVMEDALQAEFGDIQTMQDVRKLQAEDPFRFQAWQVRQMELTAAKSETLAVEQRQAQEKQSKRASYEAEQNKLLIELVPEMAEPKKAAELRERAIKMLTDDLKLNNDLLSRWMIDDTGHEILSNAGIQKLIADGLKYRDIQNAPKAVAAKPVPPVQRPGVARASGDAASDQIKALEDRLTRTGSEKDAWALYEAKLNASSRRAS